MPTQQPNIIFLLIDDLGWMDLSCYGSSFYETPNLDRLAAEGMRCTDAYASCPVCSPTRASVMSGKNPARVGITQFIGGHATGRLCDVPYFYQLPESEYSIARALGAGGYQTWHVGKWHLGGRRWEPQNHGFDVNVGGCGWGMPQNGYFAPWGMPNLDEAEEGTYLTDHLTDRAIGLIEERDAGRPFFLNFCHYAVHTPIQAPAELVAKYEAKARELGLDQQQAIEEGEPYPCEHKKHLRVTRRRFQSDPVYAAMVENLDHNIGRLLEALDAAGLRDDTLVVFSSDNGGLSTAEGSPTCNAPLAEGKGWMYEGGTRVCQLARWPGVVPAGATTAVPMASADLYPTFLEAAGLPLIPEQHQDGTSILPALRGEDQERGPLYWHYPHYGNQGGTPGASIRQGDWKLIRFFEDDRRELYHLGEDLEEQHDRAATETARVAELDAELQRWQEEVEALFPKPNPNWTPSPLDLAPGPTEPGVDPAEV